jgi:hypothetical protein
MPYVERITPGVLPGGFGKPEPIGMKIYSHGGQEAFDHEETTEKHRR